MDVLLEAQTKPLSTLSAYSYIPPRRNEPKEMSYFNNDSKVSDVSTYDQVFHQVDDFDMRLRRDDRKHWRGRGLDINQEPQQINKIGDSPGEAPQQIYYVKFYNKDTTLDERSRAVPALSSSEYGRRSSAALFQTHQRHARVACIKAEFYMKNGILWNLEEGYGPVVPV